MIWILIIVTIILLVCMKPMPKTVSWRVTDEKIPHIIWTYWHDDVLPDVITQYISTWKKHNPAYTITVVSKNTIGTYLPDVSWKCATTPQLVSDHVRVHLLSMYGGFWMDASIIMNGSLDTLLEAYPSYDFIGYTYNHNVRFTQFIEPFFSIIPRIDTPKTHYLESFFFGCTPNNTFVTEWKNEMIRLNTFDSIGDYMCDVKKQKVNIKKIQDVNYFIIYVTAQVVLQKKIARHDVVAHMKILDASSGPYAYLDAHLWRSEPAVQSLCTDEHKPLFYKLTRTEREVLENSPEVQSCVFKKSIPKIIWTYWDENEIPENIQMYIATWRKHNSNYDIRVVSRNTIQTYLPEVDILAFKFAVSPEKVSDLVRVHLLAKYGGVWADASIIMNDSLDKLIDDHDFIGYTLYDDAPITNYLENWFFMCTPHNPFMIAWKNEMVRINTFDSMDAYIQDMEAKHVQFDRIGNNNHYLWMHIAALHVLQKKMKPEYVTRRMKFMEASHGPFKYLEDNGWDLAASLQSICTSKDTPIFYKLRGADRKVLDTLPDVQKCMFQ